jgi:hypothetical protein
MPAIDAVCWMYPSPRSIIAGSAARTACTCDITFTRHCKSQVSTEPRKKSASLATPALLQRTSIRPNCDCACRIISVTWSSAPRSQGIAKPPTTLATSAAPSALRSTTAIPAAPSAANCWHSALPMPDAPPVTTQNLPVTRMALPFHR